MRSVLLLCAVTFWVVFDLSFTAIGDLVHMRTHLLSGGQAFDWRSFCLIAACLGAPFLGSVARIWFPGAEGRWTDFLGFTG